MGADFNLAFHHWKLLFKNSLFNLECPYENIIESEECFSNVNVPMCNLEILKGFRIQLIWGWGWSSSLSVSSQMMLILLVYAPHFSSKFIYSILSSWCFKLSDIYYCPKQAVAKSEEATEIKSLFKNLPSLNNIQVIYPTIGMSKEISLEQSWPLHQK